MTITPKLWDEIKSTEVAPGTLVMWWLYQSGVIFKSSGGTVIAVDPYLSDSVTRSYGLPRNVIAPIDPAAVELDALLATHSHEDHLDPDSILPFLSHDRTIFIGPPMAADKVVASGVDSSRTTPVARGESLEIGDIGVRVVHARHEFGLEPTPDAVGYIIESDGITVYHSGDTEYDSQIIADTRGVTASLISINGTTGNMNVHEAAMLAWQQGALLAIPFHYGLWRDVDYGEGATLDPQQFVNTLHRLDPEARAFIFQGTAPVTLSKEGLV